MLAELPVAVLEGWTKEFTKDIYYPANSSNPQIRLRQRGESYVLTKKYPVVEGDLSTMIEETIQLTKNEYDFFEASLVGKSVTKNRYSMNFEDYIVEIDEYLESLTPLIVLDIEWRKVRGDYAAKVKQFHPIKEITNVNALAAGKLAGKTYEQIKEHL